MSIKIQLTSIVLIDEEHNKKVVGIILTLPESTDEALWQCRFRFDGLHKNERVVFGNDALQAISLCIGTIRCEIASLRKSGLRILDATEQYDYSTDDLVI